MKPKLTAILLILLLAARTVACFSAPAGAEDYARYAGKWVLSGDGSTFFELFPDGSFLKYEKDAKSGAGSFKPEDTPKGLALSLFEGNMTAEFYLSADGTEMAPKYSASGETYRREADGSAFLFGAPITAKSAVLIEETTGKVLYAKNPDLRVYPASVTKVLTALVALEYLDPEENIVVGDEIDSVPWDSSKAGNQIGETVRADNLIRLLIIPSGNETACVAARAVARKVSGNPNIPYPQAEALFADLMNKKAAELGAAGSHFVNPHGYDDVNHYTTAADMAKICRAAMSVPLIREIVGEKTFEDDGAGRPQSEAPEGTPIGALWTDASGVSSKEYNIITHNELIRDASEHFYPYATGIKTGNTDLAGECLAASASKDGKSLIALAFDSPGSGRWLDAKNMFEYGFDNYSFVVVADARTALEELPVTKPRLGAPKTAPVGLLTPYIDFLKADEAGKIRRQITYDSPLVKGGQLTGPVSTDEILGKVSYDLDGKTVFEGDLAVLTDVEKRGFLSDVSYFAGAVRDNAFTAKGAPFWILGVCVCFIAANISSARKKRRKNTFSMRRGRRRRKISYRRPR
ncbi:MAG: D-alanyl-D-alanine carboxypeptidase [Clostridiales bacterium]|nr:D-alanyl-D-alanine carboxypeptidase [Clostridiales bacterium]